jgi:hypothetical protein
MKPIAGLVSIAILLMLVSGCTSKPQIGTIVKCSDYHEITDKYITPGPCDEDQRFDICHYVAYDSGRRSVFNSTYQNTTIGQFIDNDVIFVNRFNFTRLSELESGLRDACLVKP